MKEAFEITILLKTSPSKIYEAWLDSALHSKMTGGKAECSSAIGSPFTAWDGYISGINKELKPYQEIVQSWRTVEFTKNDEDSYVKIVLTALENETELRLIHTNIPEGKTQYKQGWITHYFEPMKSYFENQG